jgi:RNA polymerase sigma factor (sigma-70 family)
MNEPAKIRHISPQHPLLGDRVRLARITSNMDLTIQKIIYKRVIGESEERLLCGGVSARDVLQEAVIDLLQVDPASLSRSWEALSVTIARRRAADAIRASVRGRRARNAPADDPDEINVVEFDSTLWEHNLAAATDDEPERAFMLNEQQKVLLRLARDLPEQQRTIFSAVHFRDRTRDAVGKEVGLTGQRVGQIYTATLRELWERARSDPAFPSEVDWKEQA